MKVSSLLSALLILAGVSTAHALGGGASGLHFGLSALKYDTNISGDAHPTASKSARTHADLKLGYLGANELYVGVIHSLLNISESSRDPSRTATGVTVGYHSDGWFFDLSYFTSSEFKYSNTEHYKDGTGFQAEFGYNFMMGSNFYMGLELAYKTLTYKKLNSGGFDYSSSNTFTELMPLFNLGFYF